MTSYLALAHNYRNPDSGVSKPTILHSFGREDELDPEASATADGLDRPPPG